MKENLQISEKVFLATVVGLAQTCGWLVVHFRPGRTAESWRTAVQGDGKGFPDILAMKGKRVVVAELKSQNAPGLTVDQEYWLYAFKETGAEVYTWRPSDWATIEQVFGEGRLS